MNAPLIPKDEFRPHGAPARSRLGSFDAMQSSALRAVVDEPATAPLRSERPARVVLVMDYALDYLGGAQSAFLEQARALSDAGHEVTVLAPAPQRWSHPWRPAPQSFVEVAAPFVLPGIGLPGIRNTAALRRRLEREFIERGVDVVHVHSEFGLTAAALAVAEKLRIRTVSTVHTFYWQAALPRPLAPLAALGVVGFSRWLRGGDSTDPVGAALREVTRRAAARTGTVISPSAHQAEHLRAAGLAQTVSLENVVAAAAEAPLPIGRVDGPLRILWVGRMEPEKRVLEFVEAVALAAERAGHGRLDIRIAGDGSLRTAAERLALKHAAPIRFLGAVPRDRVRALMRDSHLVALTSYGFDNQPVTVAEALSEGRPVLYADPVLTEGLDEAGILTAAPSANGIADTVVQLAARPELVVEASGRAVLAARRFSADRHVPALQRVYSGR